MEGHAPSVTGRAKSGFDSWWADSIFFIMQSSYLLSKGMQVSMEQEYTSPPMQNTQFHTLSISDSHVLFFLILYQVPSIISASPRANSSEVTWFSFQLLIFELGNVYPVSESHFGSQSLKGTAQKAGYQSHYAVTNRYCHSSDFTSNSVVCFVINFPLGKEIFQTLQQTQNCTMNSLLHNRIR